ncbi:TVP38/TMEM64 family protein [Radiobacillus deserti]|nr:TVP38/TMEM64 family protein [Radiobacillus deserti]
MVIRCMHTCSLLIRNVFLFSIIGMAISTLITQSTWLDMRLEGAYAITVLVGVSIWLTILLFIMEGRPPLLAIKRKMHSFFVALAALLISTMVPLMNGDLYILPAYSVKLSLFMQQSWSISAINVGWIAWIIIGLITIFWTRADLLPNKKQDVPSNKKLAIFIVTGIGALFWFLYFAYGPLRLLVNELVHIMIQADITVFKEYVLSFGSLAAIVSALLMVFQSVIAPLPAFVITFTNGIVFGWLWGALLSWSSAMLGATLCFYLAKWFGRPLVERLVSKKALFWWDAFFEKYGSYSILIARLVPVISFDLVSYGAGLTTVTFWRFFWATGLGQMPATILYSYLGERATGQIQILFLLFTITIAIGIIGILVKPKLVKWKYRNN